MKVTLHRFGRNRRLVLILEWLTLWPTSGPLAVSSQRRAITKSSSIPGPSVPQKGRRGGSKTRPSREPLGYRGSAAGRQGFGAAHLAFSSEAGTGSREENASKQG